MLLGFFMNAAIDQQCELYQSKWLEKVEAKIKAIYKRKG
jgi:methylmalonyl-CoA mutase